MKQDILNEQTLRAALSQPISVIYYPATDSTNNEARRLLEAGRREIMLLVAGEQTAGRGRQGKSFYSPAGSGVYFSLVLPWEGAAKDALSVTTAACVAVCRALETHCCLSPQIKWVNDVYLNGKKVCGILTEAVTDPTSGALTLIVGIGINISTQDFPPEVKCAGALHVPVNRAALIAAVFEELAQCVHQPFCAYADGYRARLMLTGKPVVYTQNGAAYDATVCGIDEEGGLIVQLADGSRRTLRSGEITVREKD